MVDIELPKSHRAITIDGPGKASVKTSQPLPKLRDDYILVKTYSVALNPTDWKHIDRMPTEGALVGCDFAGTVVEVGSKVTKPFKPGDRVAGMAHGCNAVEKEDGSFAEYVVAKGDVQLLVPDRMSFAEASTFGVGYITVGQGLIQSLKLPSPDKPTTDGTPVLIYGGSSATGTLAIQIAKLSGLKVFTTCSKRNFELLKSLGADEVFDYSSPTCAEDINKATGNNLQYAWDTIGDDNAVNICFKALSTSSGKETHYSSINGPKKGPRETTTNGATMAYTMSGESFKMGAREFPPVHADFEFAKYWAGVFDQLLAEGKLKGHPQDVREGGLDKVVEGLDDLRNGKVSGKKLVYNLDR